MINHGKHGALLLRPTVLVVEDEEPYTVVMRDILSEYGYEVHIANDAVEALSLLSGVILDLILVDVIMPEVNGDMLLRMLRTDHSRAAVPIVLMSALFATKDREAADFPGADGYLAKPFTIQQLEDAISEFVQV